MNLIRVLPCFAICACATESSRTRPGSSFELNFNECPPFTFAHRGVGFVDLIVSPGGWFVRRAVFSVRLEVLMLACRMIEAKNDSFGKSGREMLT